MPGIGFRFTRANQIANPELIDFTVGGSAVYGVDYSVQGADSFTSSDGKVTIAANTTTKDIIISAVPQSIASTKSVSLTLSQLSSGTFATTGAVNKNISIPGPSDTATTLTFGSSGDSQGVFHHIGRQDSGTWVNPVSSQLQIERSSVGSGNVSELTNRVAGDVRTGNASNSWIAFDLGSKRKLTLNHYSLRHRSADKFEALRSWKIEGANTLNTWDVAGIDGATWTAIDTKSNNDSLDLASEWASFPVSGQATGYRYLRIIQTGVNSNNAISPTSTLCLGEIEFYGSLVETPASTVSLLRFNDSNGSDFISDVNSDNTWTNNGNTTISSAQVQSGIGSLLLDNAAKTIQLPYSANTAFLSMFEWDFWIYPTIITGSYRAIMGNAVGGSTGTGGRFVAIHNSQLVFRSWASTTGVVCANLVVNQWQRVIARKINNSYYLSLAGVWGTPVVIANETTPNNPFTIGGVPSNGGNASNFEGYIDNIQLRNL